MGKINKRMVIAAAFLIGLFTIACGSGKPNASTDGAASTAPAPVGQDVRVADVRWKVLDAKDMGKTLKAPNEFTKDLSTPGHFVQVHFEIENLGKDMSSFTGLDVVDSKDRTFKSSSDAFAFIPEQERCVLENLNPNVAKTCTVLYAVPADATGLKAKVTDLKMFGGDSALIDLAVK